MSKQSRAELRDKKSVRPFWSVSTIVMLTIMGAICYFLTLHLIQARQNEAASHFEITSTISWEEQQKVWQECLEDIKSAVAVGNDEDRTILSFLEQNGNLVDATHTTLSPLPGERFQIVVVNGDPFSASPSERELGGSELVAAQYIHPITTLVVKKTNVPRKINGTIGFHEAVHVYHYRHDNKAVSIKDLRAQAEEELSAYTPQVRMFRKLYDPGYEPFRTKLISLIRQDMAVRISRLDASATPTEHERAHLPDIGMILQVVDDATAKHAFGLSEAATREDLIRYLNFAFLDAAYAAIEKDTSPSQAHDQKVALMGYMISEGPHN
jgi:hypothetical protein